MIGSIIAWLVLGIIAGALAKLIMPGKQGGGIVMTIILGIVGAVVFITLIVRQGRRG